MPKPTLVSSPLDDIGATLRPEPSKLPEPPRRAGRSRSVSTPAPPSSSGRAWEANHKPVTFYCPLDVLKRIEEAMATSARSKSRVIVDALCQHLGMDRP